MKKLFTPLLWLLSFYASSLSAQGFYSIDSIQQIEIKFYQANWDYILDTSKQGADGYLIAEWVRINGIQYDSAGVKYKGNSSYNPANDKNPLHIELNYVKNQDYQGYKDIKLANGYHEPSFIREALSYEILGKYMAAPLSNFAGVTINGQYMGLYASSEAITKTFVDKRFYSNDHSFFFCDNPGGNLRYKGPDSALYYSIYTIKSGNGWADLLNLCSTLKMNPGMIENILDVDRTLWMFAFTNVLVALDSYIGQPSHNYYLYQDHHGRFNPIVWDLNGSFGIFNKPGAAPPLSIPQMQSLSPDLHISDSLWPLVKQILSVPGYKKMYIAHAKTIVEENFADSSYYFNALYYQSVIDTAIQGDPNKFYTYQEFLNNINTTVVDSDGKVITGITELMEARKIFLNGTAEFQAAPPALTGIQSSDTFPLLNSIIYITAQVSNATAVFCGLRNSVMDKFTRVQMFDDGLHGDGTAGDGNYGVDITVTSPEIQYYIYAENNSAGIFSPPRAEHEWFAVTSDYATVNAGEIVINEMLAVNTAGQANGLGNFNDWVEFYNNTSGTLSLNNLYLSDNIVSPAKWQFPEGTVILPDDYLIVWADNDVFSNELHSGYKLSGSGEQLILSYANGKIIDSLSFPVQSPDIAWGRYPNGTGNFGFLQPTFSAANSLLSIENMVAENGIFIYPNPASEFVFSGNNFSNAPNAGEVVTAAIMNILGEELEAATFKKGEQIKMDVRNLSPGIYFIVLNDGQSVRAEKIVIER